MTLLWDVLYIYVLLSLCMSLWVQKLPKKGKKGKNYLTTFYLLNIVGRGFLTPAFL